MKKIIFVFGFSGSGRKTLIKNISNNLYNIRELLGVESDRVSFANIPFNKDHLIMDYASFSARKKAVFNCIINFMADDNDVLFLNGESVDYDRYNNLLNQVIEGFPTIEKEILFLCPSNLTVYYNRFSNSEWFKSNYKRNLVKFPKDWLDFATNYMRNKLFNYDGSFKVCELDTSNGYYINSADNKKIFFMI